MTQDTSTPTPGDQTKTNNQRHKGRPPRPKARPHISIPGDELWPVIDLAAEFGMSERSFKRRFKDLIQLIAGVCYAANLRVRQRLADGIRAPKRGRR